MIHGKVIAGDAHTSIFGLLFCSQSVYLPLSMPMLFCWSQNVSWRPARRDWRDRASPTDRANSGVIARSADRKRQMTKHAHVNELAADLPVRRVHGAVHFIADLTLPYGRVLHD
jgi:hypothetical protein